MTNLEKAKKRFEVISNGVLNTCFSEDDINSINKSIKLAAQPDWYRVSDKLPEDGTEVRLYDNETNKYKYSFFSEGFFGCYGFPISYIEPTKLKNWFWCYVPKFS